MRIGILGSGLMAGKLGTLFARAGHEVVFSYARSEQKLERLAREAQGNARTGMPADAAREADALLLAVHWSRIDDVLKQAGDLSGKVIVTCWYTEPFSLLIGQLAYEGNAGPCPGWSLTYRTAEGKRNRLARRLLSPMLRGRVFRPRGRR